MDVGTGDGAFVYRSAQGNPDCFFVGVDSNAENIADYSRKAARKLAKGGLRNVLFVQADSEDLPEELDGLASAVSILFPWGSLLRSVVVPEVPVLRGFRRACRPNGKIRVVVSYDEVREAGIMAQLELPALTQEHLEGPLAAAYREAGFVIEAEYLDRSVVQRIPSTWAKRLAQGKHRTFLQLVGTAL